MTAVILFSGGQDSTISLFWAREKFDELVLLSFDYGQRNAAELIAAAKIAGKLSLPHRIMDVGVFAELADSSLVVGGSGQRYQDTGAAEGLPASFVPGRNILFLTVAAAFATKLGAKDLVIGASQADYSGYPDCRRVFIDAMQLALTAGLPSESGPFNIHTPLMDLTKADGLRLATKLPGCWAALGMTVSCYRAGVSACGECESCKLRASSFAEAGRVDPAAKAVA